MTMLEFLRALSGLLWVGVFLLLLGSALRTFGRNRRPSDWAWAWPWAFAIHQIGYAGRWWNDWYHIPERGGDITSLTGLQVLSVLLAVSVLVQRVTLEGKRW